MDEVTLVDTDQTQRSEPDGDFQPMVIPDHARIISQMSLIPQSVGIEYKELEEYFAWIKKQSGNLKGADLVSKAAALTIQNLKPSEKEWEEIVKSGADASYTLGRCISESANSCFQRAVFFHLMMQHSGVPSQVIEGRWVESRRENLTESVEGKELRFMLGNGVRVFEGDSTEEHIWNRVLINNIRTLVDTSYLFEGKAVLLPVSSEHSTYPFILLPDGTRRYYVADAVSGIEIETIK